MVRLAANSLAAGNQVDKTAVLALAPIPTDPEDKAYLARRQSRSLQRKSV